jgi:hypothetical protein
MTGDEVRDGAVAGYRKAVALREPGQAAAFLHIDLDETWLVVGAAHEPALVACLDIGLRTTVRGHFPHSEIGALEIERAIAALEDEIMPLAPNMVRAARLYTADTVAVDIARLAAIAPATCLELSRDALEGVFDRWTRAMLGHCGALDAVLESRELAVGILTLRELLHHLHFDWVTILVLGEAKRTAASR